MLLLVLSASVNADMVFTTVGDEVSVNSELVETTVEREVKKAVKKTSSGWVVSGGLGMPD